MIQELFFVSDDRKATHVQEGGCPPAGGTKVSMQTLCFLQVVQEGGCPPAGGAGVSPEKLLFSFFARRRRR